LDIETKSTLTNRIFPGRLYDTFFINEYGKIESLRASRYNNSFSVILVGIEDLPEGPDSRGEFPVDILKKAVSVLTDSVRTSDVIGMSDDRHLVVILPQTDYFGYLNVARKISKSLAAIGKDASGHSFVVSGASFPKDGKGFGELLSVALRRAITKKESIWEKEGFGTKLFWEIISDLSARSYGDLDNSSFDAGAGYEITGAFIDQINEFIIRDMTRAPRKRGILYLSARKISPEASFINSLNTAGKLAAKTFLVGEAEENLWDIKNATPIPIDDPRLKETSLTFYLGEDTGYALICKENWGGAYSCFHSSDPYLVEGLISKFQAEYSLQEQLG
jgi:hypothetical protein